MDRRIARIVLAFCFLQLVTACAIGTTPVGVYRSPFEGGSPPRDGDIVVRTFTDGRPADRQPYIGAKRNGYGMVLGHLSVPQGETLTGILSNYLVEALQHVGYRTVLDSVLAADLPADFDPDAFIEGDIADFWLDMFMATWHNVDLAVRLRDRSEEVLWEGRFKGDETNVLWIGISAEFENVIRQALDKALAAAVADFQHEDFAAQIRIASERSNDSPDAGQIAADAPEDTPGPVSAEPPTQ